MTIARFESIPDTSPFVFRQENFDVTVLSDGHFALPAEIVAPEATPSQWLDIERRLGGSAGTIRAHANIPLIRSGDDLILIDLGGGGRFQPTEGRLASSLAAAGHDREAITKVLLTHAHPDHIWGLLGSDGRLRFPNATYYVGAAEWDFWMNPDFTSSMPSVLHDFAKGAQRDLSAVRERVVLVSDGYDILPGLQAFETPGHTPGHMSYALAGPQTLVVTGDVVTNQIVSFEHPAWRFGNDTDQEVGAKTRQCFVDRAAADRLLLLGYHFTTLGSAGWRGPAANTGTFLLMFDIRHCPPDATCVDLGWNAAIHRPQQAVPRRGPGSVHDRGRVVQPRGRWSRDASHRASMPISPCSSPSPRPRSSISLAWSPVAHFGECRNRKSSQ